MKRNKIALLAAIAAILICAIGAAAQPKAKARHRPVTAASTTVHPPIAGSSNTQFGADMMEGTNIRQQQPAGGGKVPTGTGKVKPHANQIGADMMEGNNIRQQQPAGDGKVPKGTSSSTNTPSTDRRPNRRHFDHIGNKTVTTGKVKPNANQIGADLMEGSNIKQKQPAKGGKAKPASGLVTIPTDYPNIKPKPKTASHAKPRP